MPISKSTILHIDTLALRIPSLDDIPHIFSATRFEGFNDGMAWEAPKSMEELKAPYYSNIEALEKGKGYSFTIEEHENNTFYGRISIRKTDKVNRWNIGFWTHPEHQNKGIMSKALKAVLKFGFENLDADIIEACHAVWNKGSEKVLKRNGMKFISYIAKGLKKKDKWIPEHLLAIEKSEWIKLQE